MFRPSNGVFKSKSSTKSIIPHAYVLGLLESKTLGVNRVDAALSRGLEHVVAGVSGFFLTVVAEVFIANRHAVGLQEVLFPFLLSKLTVVTLLERLGIGF